MEDNTLRDGWSWIDEDVRLDGQFPLDMSHGLWEDMVDNDTVVRSLFQSNPDNIKEMDPPALSFLEQDSEDCNPAPLKRRRILEFDDENTDISSYLPEPKETCDDFLVEVCESLQIVDLASSSPVWYLANDGSLSSIDDAVEQSSGSWRAGCVSDSDTSDVQELAHRANNPPVNVVISKAILEKASGSVRQATNSTISNASQQQRKHSPGNVRTKKAGQDRTGLISRPLQECARRVLSQPSKEGPSTQAPKECSSPVLVYPFALVKPIGIQGDITLQDINQRINRTPYTVNCEQSKTALSSPYSGKSVLALTKIYTEGHGTITIMRTKG